MQSLEGVSLIIYVYAVISLLNYIERNCKIHHIWWRYNYKIFVQSVRSDSLPVLSEQMRLMEVLTGSTGDEQQESRQAEREGGVRWRDFLLRGSLTLTMEPQPATRIALSDSASHSLSLPLSLSLSLYLSVSLSLPPSFSLFHPFTLFPSFSYPLSPCLLIVSLVCWLWQPKCTTTSLLQLTPSYLMSALFPDKRV